jgi:hypothetical protein
MDWVPIAGIVAAVILGLPIVRVIVRAIDRRTGGSPSGQALPAADLADVRGQLEQLHEVTARVDELEERLDFAERLLAQQRVHGRLPAGE